MCRQGKKATGAEGRKGESEVEGLGKGKGKQNIGRKRDNTRRTRGERGRD